MLCFVPSVSPCSVVWLPTARAAMTRRRAVRVVALRPETETCNTRTSPMRTFAHHCAPSKTTRYSRVPGGSHTGIGFAPPRTSGASVFRDGRAPGGSPSVCQLSNAMPRPMRTAGAPCAPGSRATRARRNRRARQYQVKPTATATLWALACSSL
jgi:hypothetical protein